MKPFKSILAQQMEDFIEYRMQLGYSESTIKYCLKLFDRYVHEKKATWTSFNPMFLLNSEPA